MSSPGILPGRKRSLAVREILVRLIPLSRAEAGCLKYELFQNTSEPGDFTFIETFASDAALARHATAPYVVGLQTQLKRTDCQTIRRTRVSARAGRGPRRPLVRSAMGARGCLSGRVVHAAGRGTRRDAGLDRPLAGLPDIQVSATQGKLLHLMARAMGARRILEIGTLAGYSAIWLARALPADGRLVTIEVDPKHAEVARSNIAAAGLADSHRHSRGPRDSRSWPQLAADGAGPFDLTFIDADKIGYVDYLDWAISAVAIPAASSSPTTSCAMAPLPNADTGDEAVDGIRRFNAALAADARVSATAVQTVGVKGYDGFTVAACLWTCARPTERRASKMQGSAAAWAPPTARLALRAEETAPLADAMEARETPSRRIVRSVLFP
jgi:predicted O-methyltransferase YrrM/quinol monooxygenase YgiN